MRSIVPYHFEFRKKEMIGKNKFHFKKTNGITKKYDVLNNAFILNDKCEKAQ